MATIGYLAGNDLIARRQWGVTSWREWSGAIGPRFEKVPACERARRGARLRLV